MVYFSSDRLNSVTVNEITYADSYWNDLRVDVSTTKLGGTKDPEFAVFKTNGSGSQGVFVYWFDASSEEEIYFLVQIPHDYKFGTDLHPHVHWVPKTNGSAAQVVSWGLEYTISEIGANFGNTSIIYGNAHTPADASLVADRHYLTEIGTISGAAIDTVSSMLICRLFRNATGAGSSTDDYADDAALLEFDLHYEIDTPGSRDEYTK